MLDAYPSITIPQFTDACEAFEKRCHDQLDNTSWLGVRWTGVELLIREQRVLSAKCATMQNAAQVNKESNDLAIEDVEDECCATPDQRQRIDESCVEVNFSVTLSPTYAVPVLWLRSPSINNIDQLYEVLVPSEQREHTRDVGVMGGLSQAYHPISDLPSFFVHPCNTHQALLAVKENATISVEHYLLIWLGIVGSCVDLHVPSKLMAQPQQPSETKAACSVRSVPGDLVVRPHDQSGELQK